MARSAAAAKRKVLSQNRVVHNSPKGGVLGRQMGGKKRSGRGGGQRRDARGRFA